MSDKSGQERSPTREDRQAAITEELRERDRRIIRALLRKPMNERTHFLRKKLPNGGSHL